MGVVTAAYFKLSWDVVGESGMELLVSVGHISLSCLGERETKSEHTLLCPIDTCAAYFGGCVAPLSNQRCFYVLCIVETTHF